MYKAVILPLAKEDIKDAAHWYNTKQNELGKRFTKEVRKRIKFIQQNPETIAIRHNDIRTALVDVFPYMIHFYIDEPKKTVVITAVFGTAENPVKWGTSK